MLPPASVLMFVSHACCLSDLLICCAVQPRAAAPTPICLKEGVLIGAAAFAREMMREVRSSVQLRICIYAYAASDHAR